MAESNVNNLLSDIIEQVTDIDRRVTHIRRSLGWVSTLDDTDECCDDKKASNDVIGKLHEIYLVLSNTHDQVVAAENLLYGHCEGSPKSVREIKPY